MTRVKFIANNKSFSKWLRSRTISPSSVVLVFENNRVTCKDMDAAFEVNAMEGSGELTFRAKDIATLLKVMKAIQEQPLGILFTSGGGIEIDRVMVS